MTIRFTGNLSDLSRCIALSAMLTQPIVRILLNLYQTSASPVAAAPQTGRIQDNIALIWSGIPELTGAGGLLPQSAGAAARRDAGLTWYTRAAAAQSLIQGALDDRPGLSAQADQAIPASPGASALATGSETAATTGETDLAGGQYGTR